MQARAVRDLGLRQASDEAIFGEARSASAVVLTKDADFVRLVRKHGPPPAVLWLRLGNSPNARVRQVLAAHWSVVRERLDAGEAVVEIGEPR